MTQEYTLKDFDFTLPDALIAQTPASPRDQARLLVYDRKTKQITDDYFYNLEKYLPKHSTIAVNNSKVEKCRLQIDNLLDLNKIPAVPESPEEYISSVSAVKVATATPPSDNESSASLLVDPGDSEVLRKSSIEIFVLETINPTTIQALVRPGRKFKLGSVKIGDFSMTVDEIAEDGIRTIRLDRPIDDKSFDIYRLTPLPPYIAQDESLAEEYQTVYADPLGSKAAPTAGLHFTPELLKKIGESHDIAEVTLHVGMGTFAPVKHDDLTKHIMHEEHFSISSDTAKLLNAANYITAVGTTTVRVLESVQWPFVPQIGSTSIFITPGYEFKAVDALITNFHLPKSTLLMLVATFIGSVDEMHRIYEYAIKNQYRFYSFGDAMLIL